MKNPEVNFLKKETESVLSVLSWLESEEWKKDPNAVVRVGDTQNFVNSLNLDSNLKHSFTPAFVFDFESSFKEEIKKLIKDKLKEKVLIDLGTGNSSNLIINFFKEMKLKELICVEKFPVGGTSSFQKKLKVNSMKGDYFTEDMLVFLSKLPDNSANFFMAGVDFNIIPNEEYWQRLQKEILRTIYKDGIFFGHTSNIEKLEGFENELNTHSSIENFVFTKQENK